MNKPSDIAVDQAVAELFAAGAIKKPLTERQKGEAGQALLNIRNHPKLGRGSCSTVDECYSDEDLLEILIVGLSVNTFWNANGAIKALLKEEKAREGYAAEIAATAF